MSIPSKVFGIDDSGRVLISEAGDERVASAQLDVNDARVLLTTNTLGLKRRKLFVKNVEEPVVYVGGAQVSPSDGFPLYQFDEVELDVGPDAQVKAVRAVGQTLTRNVHILEVE